MPRLRIDRLGLVAVIGVLALLVGAPPASSVARHATTIDGTTVATVKVGTRPGTIVLDAAGGRLFVQDAVTDMVAVIDTASNAVTASFAVPGGTSDLVFDQARSRLYAVSGSDPADRGVVTVIDATTYEPVASVKFAGAAGAAVLDARRGLLYVLVTADGTGAGSVATIDVVQARVRKTTRVGRYPWATALDASGKHLYVSGEKPARVYVLETASGRVAAAVTMPGYLQYLLVDSAHSRVYGVRSSGLSVIDAGTNRVVGTVRTVISVEGSAPVLDSASRRLYAVNDDANEVTVVNTATNKVASRAPLVDYAESLLLDKAHARLYVANFDEGDGHTLSVIDTQTRSLLGSIPVGKGPQLPQLDSSSDRLYVPNWGSGSITVIDTRKVP